MKYTIYLLLLITVISSKAERWNDPVYFEYLKDVLLTQHSFDSTGNLWVGSTRGFWIIPPSGDTTWHVDEIVRGKDTIRYTKWSNQAQSSSVINFTKHSALARYNYGIDYITDDTIIRFDKEVPVFKEFGIDSPILRQPLYDDSSFLCLIENYVFKYPGVFKFSERTLEWEFLMSYDSVPYIPQIKYEDYKLHKLKDNYVYPSYYYNITYFDEKGKYAVNLRELVQDTNQKIESYLFKDSLLYFTNNKWQMFTLNLYTMDYTVEDLSTTAMHDTCKNVNPDAQFNVCEVNEDFSIAHITYINQRYGFFIKYKDEDWELIDRPNDPIRQYDGPERLYMSPDKKRLWFFFYWGDGIKGKDGKWHFKGAVSYNIYKDTTSVAEETESFPTVLPTKLYPNPAKRMVTVNFFLNPNYREKVKFEIYDYMGCKIKELDGSYSYNASEAFGSKQIDVEDISTGIYYLVIDNGSEKRSIGFAVE